MGEIRVWVHGRDESVGPWESGSMLIRRPNLEGLLGKHSGV